MPSFRALLKLGGGGGPGPSPSFSQAHVLLALLAIGDSKMIGRQALAGEIGLGEGVVRTILKKLTASKYVETIASGCRLTHLGRQVHDELRRVLSQVVFLDARSLSVGTTQASVRVKGGGRRLGNGIAQRDAAILVGAAGATTYTIRAGKFAIPGGSRNCERDFPSPAWKKLRSEFQLREGDAVVLCGADDTQRAKVGAVSASLTLL